VNAINAVQSLTYSLQNLRSGAALRQGRKPKVPWSSIQNLRIGAKRRGAASLRQKRKTKVPWSPKRLHFDSIWYILHPM
jgi:hypothetical protein